jgi:hypothetical protein
MSQTIAPLVVEGMSLLTLALTCASMRTPRNEAAPAIRPSHDAIRRNALWPPGGAWRDEVVPASLFRPARRP